MDKLRRLAKELYGFFGVGAFVIALADIPAQIAIWSKWFAALSPYLHTLTFRWFLGCVGILVALFPWILEWLRPRISVDLLPTSGQRQQMDLRVTNRGKGREFYAQCEFLALRHSPNPLSQVCYSLKWESTNSKRLFLAKGETANLLIARAEQDHKLAFAQMDLLGLNGEEVKSYEWAGWNTNSRERLPEYDIRITILSDGAKKPIERKYSLRPKKFHGPLEMFELRSEVAV